MSQTLKRKPRRPLKDDEPHGVMESDLSFVQNNLQLAAFLLENIASIPSELKSDSVLIDERDAEQLMAQAFENVITHLEKMGKEIDAEVFRLTDQLHNASREGETPNQLQERRRVINILTGRAQGVANFAAPTLASAAMMILAEDDREKEAPKIPDPIIII